MSPTKEQQHHQDHEQQPPPPLEAPDADIASPKAHPKIPADFLCAMTHQIMSDPMMSRYGTHYEKLAILGWLNKGYTYCPITHKPLRPSNLISDKNLQVRIVAWKRSNMPNAEQDNESEELGSQSFHNDMGDVTPVQKEHNFELTCPLTPSRNGRASASASLDLVEAAKETPVQRTPSSRMRRVDVDQYDNISSLMLSPGYISLFPDHFRCPLSKRCMKDPVMTRTGINYERNEILEHLQKHGYTCPITNHELKPSGIVANYKLQWEIEKWHDNFGSASLHGRSATRSTPRPKPLKNKQRARSTNDAAIQSPAFTALKVLTLPTEAPSRQNANPQEHDNTQMPSSSHDTKPRTEKPHTQPKTIKKLVAPTSAPVNSSHRKPGLKKGGGGLSSLRLPLANLLKSPRGRRSKNSSSVNLVYGPSPQRSSSVGPRDETLDAEQLASVLDDVLETIRA